MKSNSTGFSTKTISCINGHCARSAQTTYYPLPRCEPTPTLAKAPDYAPLPRKIDQDAACYGISSHRCALRIIERTPEPGTQSQHSPREAVEVNRTYHCPEARNIYFARYLAISFSRSETRSIGSTPILTLLIEGGIQ